MKFAVDGMGGDHAPVEVVKGCVQAVQELAVELVLCGDEELLRKELAKYEVPEGAITILPTTEVISLDESPVMAIRKKKDSSMRRAIELVRDGECQGIISAGSTGALLAGGLFLVGRIKGIDRPALAPLIPGQKGHFTIVDVGANTDCKPINLHQFAYMGKIYFESILGHVNPKVGLINIGAESEKGNELTKEVYSILSKDEHLNFVGNVEPREVLTGDVQILVADGFVGNTVLKTLEGSIKTILEIMKGAMTSSPQGALGGLLIKKPLKKAMSKFDYKETGGSAFLGLKGIVVKAHGSSDAKAFKNAIRQAKQIHQGGFIGKFKEAMEKNLLQGE